MVAVHVEPLHSYKRNRMGNFSKYDKKMLVWTYGAIMPQSYLKKWREDKTELLLCKTIPYFCSLILNQIFFLPISTLKNGGGGGVGGLCSGKLSSNLALFHSFSSAEYLYLVNTSSSCGWEGGWALQGSSWVNKSQITACTFHISTFMFCRGDEDSLGDNMGYC